MNRLLIRSTITIAVLVLGSMQSSAQKGLMIGSVAPSFKGKDNSGNTIELKELLKSNKAVVLFFYRGQWCPYCNKYLTQMQDSLQMLIKRGAYVVAVTPENESNIDKTVEKTHASFSILQDAANKIMKDYDVLYTADDNTMAALKQYGIDLDKSSGNQDHDLPVPATYIIDRSGKISYVYFNKDYKQRVPVKTLLEHLP